MKKFILLLVFPVFVFSQFEDTYYVISDQEFKGSPTYLKEFNVVTNTIENEYQLLEEFETGEFSEMIGGKQLTYQPNSDKLYIQQEKLGFKMESGGEFIIYENTPQETECYIIGTVTGYMAEVGAVDGSKSTSIVRNSGDAEEFYYISDQYTIGVYVSTKLMKVNLPEETSSELIDLSDFGDTSENQGSFQGLTYKPESNELFLIGNGLENERVLYSYSLNSNTITQIPINFDLEFNFGAMHYLRGQNKIMIVDNWTGDFYLCDLATNEFSMYAETDLEFVTGIVNKQDFLGNYEVENQGVVTVYPNPVKDILMIKSDQKIERIELYNIVGQKLNQYNANSSEINLGDKSRGVYILKIRLANGKTETKKLIKQ
ncbi:T9SS type A sorting domain-containing protein [Moheibacter lacus]|uniref:T9SS type A sorting domain-containing protein n=1 Tax=Moheibacter lacus TaxID=2745851 RepID=A0A838ZNY2_9FLAO|nr:T9SS type A sorting domain-containing protein [Moheibacter lacus]MBA5629017.1 T9SS type A sorting domain-containing protein [Moheibacter lacus]